MTDNGTEKPSAAARKTPPKPVRPASRAAAKPSEAKAAKRPSRAKEKAVSAKAKVESSSKLIDERIQELGDWRGKTLQRIREIMKEADPEIIEEWKWETPVWSRNGLICTGEAYKNTVKMTFAKGASLKDPSRLFNASLEGKVRRAIDIREGDKLNEKALKNLIREAVALNLGSKSPSQAEKPVLLTGGNPQIPKGDGDAPVQAYIAAMPGWKSDIGRRLDALIERTVPGVRKAVKWNSPLYGIEGQGWFLGIHCFTKYIKLAFFRGASLQPVPPVESKDKNTRYFHIHEGDRLDEERLARWIKQASQLPGWIP